MTMSNEEIAREYRTAGDKKKQIGILADLNCCTKQEIAQILTEQGEKVDGRMIAKRTKPAKEIPVDVQAEDAALAPEEIMPRAPVDPPMREEDPKPKHDPVNHPDHYTRGGIECIDAIQAVVTDLPGKEAWLVGQIIKYVWRYRWKNGAEDLKKARFYLDRLIQEAEA